MEKLPRTAALGVISVGVYALILRYTLPLYPSWYPRVFLAAALAYVVPTAVTRASYLVSPADAPGSEASGSRPRAFRIVAAVLLLCFVPVALSAPPDATTSAYLFAGSAVAALLLTAVVLGFDLDRRLRRVLN